MKSKRVHICPLDAGCWRDYFRYGMPLRVRIGTRQWTVLSGERRSHRIWDEGEPVRLLRSRIDEGTYPPVTTKNNAWPHYRVEWQTWMSSS